MKTRSSRSRNTDQHVAGLWHEFLFIFSHKSPFGVIPLAICGCSRPGYETRGLSVSVIFYLLSWHLLRHTHPSLFSRLFLRALPLLWQVVVDADETCDGTAQNDMGECRMDIFDSTVAYLGYDATESYGITWKVTPYVPSSCLCHPSRPRQ